MHSLKDDTIDMVKSAGVIEQNKYNKHAKDNHDYPNDVDFFSINLSHQIPLHSTLNHGFLCLTA
jgi:hypothetical protein